MTIIQLMIRKAQMDRSPLRSLKKSQLVSVLFLNHSLPQTEALIHFISTRLKIRVFFPPATLKIWAISSVFHSYGNDSVTGPILLSKTFLGWEGGFERALVSLFRDKDKFHVPIFYSDERLQLFLPCQRCNAIILKGKLSRDHSVKNAKKPNLEMPTVKPVLFVTRSKLFKALLHAVLSCRLSASDRGETTEQIHEWKHWKHISLLMSEMGSEQCYLLRKLPPTPPPLFFSKFYKTTWLQLWYSKRKGMEALTRNKTRQTVLCRCFSRAHYRRSSFSVLGAAFFFFSSCFFLCVTSSFHLHLSP